MRFTVFATLSLILMSSSSFAVTNGCLRIAETYNRFISLPPDRPIVLANGGAHGARAADSTAFFKLTAANNFNAETGLEAEKRYTAVLRIKDLKELKYDEAPLLPALEQYGCSRLVVKTAKGDQVIYNLTPAIADDSESSSDDSGVRVKIYTKAMTLQKAGTNDDPFVVKYTVATDVVKKQIIQEVLDFLPIGEREYTAYHSCNGSAYPERHQVRVQIGLTVFGEGTNVPRDIVGSSFASDIISENAHRAQYPNYMQTEGCGRVGSSGQSLIPYSRY